MSKTTHLLKISYLILILGLALAACSPIPAEKSGAAAVQNPAPINQPLPKSLANSSELLPDNVARAAMADLTSSITQKQATARAQVVAAGDSRFISVFIELMRASQLGLVRGTSVQENARIPGGA